MAFFIPSIKFFFGLPRALLCFGIHFNAIGCNVYRFKCLEGNANLNKYLNLLFEALTAVLMKTRCFLDVTPCMLTNHPMINCQSIRRHSSCSQNFETFLRLTPSVLFTHAKQYICWADLYHIRSCPMNTARTKFDQKSFNKSNSYDVPRCMHQFSPPVRLWSELYCLSLFHSCCSVPSRRSRSLPVRRLSVTVVRS
jgi:hypothetical protein